MYAQQQNAVSQPERQVHVSSRVDNQKSDYVENW
jgi:hypothetical protein